MTESCDHGTVQVLIDRFTSFDVNLLLLVVYVKDLLNSEITLPETCLQRVAKSVILGLQDIHQLLQRGHRGVSPAEILIDGSFHPKVENSNCAVTQT